MKINKIIRLIGSLLLIIAKSDGYSQSFASASQHFKSYNTEIKSSSSISILPQNGVSIHSASDSTLRSKGEKQSKTVFYEGKMHSTLGLMSHQSAIIGFDMVNSISVFNIVAVGLGAGLRFPFDYKIISTPLYVDVRLTLSQKPIAPIIEAGWGGTFQPNFNFEQAGQIFLCQAGVKIEGKREFSFMITMGYEQYDIIAPGSYTIGQYYPSAYKARDKFETISGGTLNFGFIF